MIIFILCIAIMYLLANSSIGITDYSESFASIIQKDNFFGTQFHPEKSSDQGSKLLRTFINL